MCRNVPTIWVLTEKLNEAFSASLNLFVVLIQKDWFETLKSGFVLTYFKVWNQPGWFTQVVQERVLLKSPKFTVNVLLGRPDLKIMFFGLLFLVIKDNPAPEGPNLDSKTPLFLSSCPSTTPLMHSTWLSFQLPSFKSNF